MENRTKTLMVITTYNQLEYTKLMMKSMKDINIEGLDLLFIDDNSSDGTVEWLKKNKYKVLNRDTPKGLTESWNMAYRIFKEELYDILIISNNDILLTEISLINLISSTKMNQLCVPLTTKKGAGHNWMNQDVLKYYGDLNIDVNLPNNYEIVQNNMIKNDKIEMDIFNGFIISMSRKIIKSEFDSDNLVNPKLINIHQEGDIYNRLTEKPIVTLNSFMYHYKGVSFKKGLDRQKLSNFHDI